MTIYLVQESAGCYEDYYASIIKAFFDINKAENYKATCELQSIDFLSASILDVS